MDPAALTRIGKLLDAQRFAVLCTSTQGWPYAGLVAFYAHPDRHHIYFATPRNTQKTANLLSDNRVALLVDNRSNSADDCDQAIAVTILGRAEILPDSSRAQAVSDYLKEHPNLTDFVESPQTAMVCVHVEHYRLVEQFQATTDIKPE